MIMVSRNSQGCSWLNQELPSPHIDAAICDLFAKLQNFSDPYSDISFVQLTERELEEIVVKLIVRLTNELQGKLLAELINEVRDYKKSL